MRLVVSGLMALVVVMVLFLFMAQLATPTLHYNTNKAAHLDLNMGRMRFDTETQLRDRSLPPPPKVTTASNQSQVTLTPSVEMPANVLAMDVPLSMDVPSLTMPQGVDIALSPPALPVISSAPQVSMNSHQIIQRDASYQAVPQYPRKALQRKTEGYVILEFLVNEEGRVDRDSVTVIESQPKGMFDRAAKKAIYRSRYEPFIQNGEVMSFKNRYRYEFKLEQ